MKKAIILVGAHHVGKSSTINEFLKPMLKKSNGKQMGYYDHYFVLNGQQGFILSQTREEAFKEALAVFLEHSEKYFQNELLVMTARPESDPISILIPLQGVLEKAGYNVTVIRKEFEDDRQQKAQEIFDVLNSYIPVIPLQKTNTESASVI